jgi:hypothetical protein
VAFKSVKLSETAYNEIGELQALLVKHGTGVLPVSLRPDKTSFDSVVRMAVRALRKRVRT